MSIIDERDWELLEMLLDGELADTEADALRRRVAAEPQLSAALEQLRAQREVRQHVWRAMEPHEAQVNALVSDVRAAIRREDAWTRRARALRYVSGLAACIVLGFVIGRFGTFGDATRDRGGGVIFDTNRGPSMEVMDNVLPHPAGGGYKVLLTDHYGTVLGEQRFSTFDEAREFTQDLGRMQRRALQLQQPLRGSDTMLIKGEF